MYGIKQLFFSVQGIHKISQKVEPLNNGFMDLLCNYLCGMGIFFDEISVSLDCCITGLWHPINRNYVFNVKIIIICDLFSYFKIMKIL